MANLDLEKLVAAIRDIEQVDAVYLYGSRAKGCAREDSDWDIAVLFSDFEPDLLERAVRPQMLEAELERRLPGSVDISVVDLQAVPVPLQWNIIQGQTLYDRGVPHVRRMEHAIISAWEKDYESKAYEQQVEDMQQEMLTVLDDLKSDIGSWKARDLLAAQRALQVVIESLVGISRYVYKQKYGVAVNKSRQGLDGLLNRGDLPQQDHALAMKMIGFRNVLVHDYLEVNRNIVEAIIKNGFYRDVCRISQSIHALL